MILEGGGACAIHALDVIDAAGLRHPLVLKRFVRLDWVEREPDVAEREAAILKALGPTALPTPELVAVDADGQICDFRAVLMTRLPGRIELDPPDMDAWLRGIAEPIPVIRGLDASFRDVVGPYETYNDLEALEVPPWSREPDAWRAVIACAQSPRSPSRECFLHRDYHPTNILWTQGRVTGVLDWTNASWGPPGVDPGHCRLNLVQLYGVDVAERFATRVLEACSEPLDARDPTCDVLCLIETLPEPSVYWGWVNLGVRRLTVPVIRERLDSYASLLASRL